MMINGVDPAETSPLAPPLRSQLEGPEKKILFVARLVEDKGCIEFVDAVSMALKAAPGRFRAIIAGSGPFAERMRERAQREGHGERFHFLGQVPHDEILSLQRYCDIYVSLNRMCNLTNANLEAMRTGMCMIIPASPGIRGIDVDTDALMPPDTIWRIADSDDAQGLSEALIRLESNPDERARRAQATFTQAEKFIPTWSERINEELKMLEHIGAARN
jgi:glycosyltransferase involved in cell wall biosynthesis